MSALAAEHLEDLLEPFSLFFGVFEWRNRARSSPAKVQPMEYTTNRLAAHHNCSLLEQLQSQQLATPARAQPTTLGGHSFFRKSLNQFLRRVVDQRLRTSPLTIIEGRLPLLHEAPEDRVDSGARTEEGAGDLGG